MQNYIFGIFGENLLVSFYYYGGGGVISVLNLVEKQSTLNN